ncbi:tRNA-dihydrouridine synthase, partial [Acinetobacter baumannii]|nr:tRNA-dihydrouridine synthase [Acinetobacter baumannii]
NLGCPSKTVVSKMRGSGFLKEPLLLQEFLEEIFSELTVSISVKTRIGMADPEEFYDLIEIYNRFPISELII